MSTSAFTNPVRWEDLPDPEVFRVGETYYMSASSFHFSPGAPVLISYDLVNWEYIGHSMPALPPQQRFELDGVNPAAYGKGVWASTLGFRKSDGLFYFYSAIQGTDQTYIYTAKDPRGIWTASPPIERFYYDLGLLIDDDDTLYIAHGTRIIQVAQLSDDGLEEVTNKIVYQSEDYWEGARMYKIRGSYYIWLTKSGDAQSVLKSDAGPFGPYELQDVVNQWKAPLAGAGAPHQGALVDTPSGEWFYMAFIDAYPVGRIPVLAPVTFNDEGWPSIVEDKKGEIPSWGLEYPLPVTKSTPKVVATCFREHHFETSSLEPCWQWNHNPDNSKWSLEDGHVVLKTGTVTPSLHLATNTLTHRTIGPSSIFTVCMDISMMKDGDRAGLSMFRDESAYIGVHRDEGRSKVVFLDGAKVGPFNVPVGWLNGRPAALDWKWISDGCIGAEMPATGNRVWLRVMADLRPAFADGHEQEGRLATFEYSFNGADFLRLGPSALLTNSMLGFIGIRFGIFNFATLALGGEIRLSHCTIDQCNLGD